MPSDGFPAANARTRELGLYRRGLTLAPVCRSSIVRVDASGLVVR
jgi:hypothetical protein